MKVWKSIGKTHIVIELTLKEADRFLWGMNFGLDDVIKQNWPTLTAVRDNVLDLLMEEDEE